MNNKNKSFRELIFDIIERSEEQSLLSTLYDYLMIVTIAISLLPLAFKQDNTAFLVMDAAAVALFMMDYILRCSILKTIG